MTDEPKETPDGDEELGEGLSDEESPALKALLKRSLAAPEPAPAPAAKSAEPDAEQRALVLAVQKKLRQRSKGKFYADGWSTTQSRVSYALVAIVMLVVIATVYVALGPTGIH